MPITTLESNKRLKYPSSSKQSKKRKIENTNYSFTNRLPEITEPYLLAPNEIKPPLRPYSFAQDLLKIPNNIEELEADWSAFEGTLPTKHLLEVEQDSLLKLKDNDELAKLLLSPSTENQNSFNRLEKFLNELNIFVQNIQTTICGIYSNIAEQEQRSLNTQKLESLLINHIKSQNELNEILFNQLKEAKSPPNLSFHNSLFK